MSEAVIVAIITGLFAVIGNALVSGKNNRELSEEFRRQAEISDTEIKGEIAVIKNELSNLSSKVAAQNSVVERVYRLEQLTAIHEERLNRLMKGD